MPGVQCVICLSSDTSSEEWCALRDCGHVFHMHCLAQSLEHNRRCPQCRMEYGKRKYGASNPPYQRVFFEFSDEPASQPLPQQQHSAAPGGGSSADLQQVAFLQGQLRDKERRIQAVSTQLGEAEERGAQLARELELARSGMREREARLQEKISELSKEHRQVKGLANQVANLSAQLKQESARASMLALSCEHTLAGPALAAEVDKLVRLGLKAPNDFWEKLMSERSQVIIAASNRHAREKAALERQHVALQLEVARLQEQVTGLKRSLAAAARQQQQQQASTGAAAAAGLPPEMRQHSSMLGAPGGGIRHGVRRLGGAAAAGVQRGDEGEEEDPLVHSYDLLNMRQGGLAGSIRRPPPQQQHQQQAAADLPAVEAAAAAEEEVPASDDDNELIVLDGSEEQEVEVEEAMLGVDHSGRQEGQRCYSGAEPEDGQGQEAGPAMAAGAEQRQQQTASGPPPAQQGQPAVGGHVLGKRPAEKPALPAQQAQQARPSWAAGRSSGSHAAADENHAGGGWGSQEVLPPLAPASAPLMAAAGPGRAALQQGQAGPGRSFIRNPAAASTGLDRGKFISSGPDGKGGVAKAYRAGGSGAPVRLAQKKLDVGALHGGSGGGSGRAQAGSAASSQETSAAQALRRNNALPITSFFTREQQ